MDRPALDLADVETRLIDWLREAFKRVGAWSSDDIHIDELGLAWPPEEDTFSQLLALYDALNRIVDPQFAGCVLLLLIPLRSSDDADLTCPTWPPTNDDLGPTPPSFYIMALSAFAQCERGERHSVSFDVNHGSRKVLGTYNCLRREDDSEWLRDIRFQIIAPPLAARSAPNADSSTEAGR